MSTETTALGQLRGLAGGMSRKQQLATLLAVAAVAVAITVFVKLMAKPEYGVLYSGLSPADVQEVGQALGGAAVPYEVGTDGASISVPVTAMQTARMDLARLGLPHSGQMGFEIFDKPDWSGSDFAEQVNYQRALEGELERTIETVQGVRTARVQLTMPHESLFTSENQPAKASVLLTLEGGPLAPDLGFAIQHLVASAVDHLDPHDVAVMDTRGDLVGTDATESQAQASLETELRNKILTTLAPVVGPDHVRADVSLVLDRSTTDNTQEAYDPKGSVLLSSQMSASGGSAASRPAVGVPGTASNMPGAQPAGINFPAQLGLSGPGSQQSQDQTFAVSRSVTHVIRPPGAILRMTAAIVLDDATRTEMRNGKPVQVRDKRSADEISQIQAMAAAAIGIDTSRGDSLTVTDLPFTAEDTAAAVPAPAPPGWQQRLLQQPSELIRYGGLTLLFLLLYAALLRPLSRSLRTAAQRASAPAALPPADTAAVNPELLAAQTALALRDHLAERVKREPGVATSVVQTWLSKPNGERA